MARKKSRELTEAELRLMNILWSKNAASVGEIIAALPAEPALAYSTVLTTLRILEAKGVVGRKKEGRAFIYEPVLERAAATKGAVRNLLSRFFNDSPEQLVASLLTNEKLTSKELARLKKLIADYE